MLCKCLCGGSRSESQIWVMKLTINVKGSKQSKVSTEHLYFFFEFLQIFVVDIILCEIVAGYRNILMNRKWLKKIKIDVLMCLTRNIVTLVPALNQCSEYS